MAAYKLNFKNLIFIIILFPVCARAQETLMVEGSGGNLYLNHTTAAKENFYSIGRLYNISPREIAPYNNLILEKGVSIGQTIKVPLKAVNFTQTNSAGAEEVTVPLYHKVEPKETLYQLSTNYNKVPVASLKEWNNLADGSVSPGKDIIVGYLKVKKELSSFAQKGVAMTVGKTEVIKVKEPAVKKEVSPGKIVPVTVPEIKTEPVKEKEIIATTPNTDPTVNKDFKGGAFKSIYTNTGKEESGIAGVFKSMSGWDDGKYYCLHNSAAQGAVVKITNTSTGKYIYAKVLDVMPDLKQNNELAVRLSNAAADALGAGMSNFNCTINY